MGPPRSPSIKKISRQKIIMENHIIRYQERETKKVEFVQVLAADEQTAMNTFKKFITDYIDETPTIITREEYREIRENHGLNPDGIDESEMTPERKKFLEIVNSEEWKAHYASGGYNDY